MNLLLLLLIYFLYKVFCLLLPEKNKYIIISNSFVIKLISNSTLTNFIMIRNCLRLSRPALCIKLLTRLDGRGLWLIIHLLNVSPHPQVYLTSRERTLLRMPLTECGETLSRCIISHRPRPSSPDRNFILREKLA